MSINSITTLRAGSNLLWNVTRFIALVTLAALTLTNSAIAEPVVPPTSPPVSLPGADSQVTEKAKEWFHRLQTADIDRSQLDAQVNSQLTADVIRQQSETLTPLGDPTGFVFVRTYPIANVLEYDFLLHFKAVQIIELISFDPGGKIAGLGFEFFAPSHAGS